MLLKHHLEQGVPPLHLRRCPGNHVRRNSLVPDCPDNLVLGDCRRH